VAKFYKYMPKARQILESDLTVGVGVGVGVEVRAVLSFAIRSCLGIGIEN